MDEMTTTENFLQRQYDKIEQRRNSEIREILREAFKPAVQTSPDSQNTRPAGDQDRDA